MKNLIEKAKELEFNTESEFLEYIYLSKINGNNAQCKELFKSLEGAEVKQFERFMIETTSESNLIEFFKFLSYSKTQIENIFFDNWESVPHIEM